MITKTLLCIGAYCLGSISTAVLVCRWMGLPDPRSQGSQNPGATNVLRTGHKGAAAITLIGDVLKGLMPVFIAMHVYKTPLIVGLVMLSVFLGHLYPIFFQFRGGKGVATAAGAFLALDLVLGFVLIGIWLLMMGLFRMAALSAVVVALIAPCYVWHRLGFPFAIPVAMISVLIIWRHRSNMQRLWQGTEPTVGRS